MISLHQKQAVVVVEKLDRAQAGALVAFEKGVRARHARELKSLQSDHSHRLKMTRSETTKVYEGIRLCCFLWEKT